MRDDLPERLSSALILGPKWSNTKFVYLFGPAAISNIVNNTGMHRSLSITCSVSVTSANIAMKDISL